MSENEICRNLDFNKLKVTKREREGGGRERERERERGEGGGGEGGRVGEREMSNP